MSENFELSNDAKASFDDIYVKPDPRAYFSVLGSLDYMIPDLAKPIVQQLAAAWRSVHGRSATVMDLGASYGINAALLRFPLTFRMLRRRYARRAMLNLPTEDLQLLDQYYYKSWPRTHAERILVADVSQPAVDYAVRVGLGDTGIAGSFEEGLPSPDAAEKVASVNLIMSTGCVGYVSEKTFTTITQHTKSPPWVVSFVLRMFDYGPIEDRLGRVGLRTEKLESAVFVQRRFRDEDEAGSVLDVLAQRGVDPAGLEADGLLFAELYVSRPEAEVKAAPLNELVTVTSGRNINYGPRLLQLRRGGRDELAPVRM